MEVTMSPPLQSPMKLKGNTTTPDFAAHLETEVQESALLVRVEQLEHYMHHTVTDRDQRLREFHCGLQQRYQKSGRGLLQHRIEAVSR